MREAGEREVSKGTSWVLRAPQAANERRRCRIVAARQTTPSCSSCAPRRYTVTTSTSYTTTSTTCKTSRRSKAVQRGAALPAELSTGRSAVTHPFLYERDPTVVDRRSLGLA